MSDGVNALTGKQNPRKKTDRLKAHRERAHAATLENRSIAWDWHMKGASVREIAKMIGLSPAAVHGYITETRTELQRLHEGPEKRAEQYHDAMARAKRSLLHWEKQLEAAPRSTKIGQIIFKYQRKIADLNGLISASLKIEHKVAMPASGVLERVKQVQGRVVSPLVAEKLPQLPKPPEVGADGEA